jgi:hypothetical protein
MTENVTRFVFSGGLKPDLRPQGSVGADSHLVLYLGRPVPRSFGMSLSFLSVSSIKIILVTLVIPNTPSLLPRLTRNKTSTSPLHHLSPGSGSSLFPLPAIGRTIHTVAAGNLFNLDRWACLVFSV